MDLVKWSSIQLPPITFLMRVLEAIGVPVFLRKTFAVIWQGIVEGGIYFSTHYLIADQYLAYNREVKRSGENSKIAKSSSETKIFDRIQNICNKTRNNFRSFAVVFFPFGVQLVFFRTTVCLLHGWPQSIVIGAPAPAKRMMFSSLPYRIPSVLCILYMLRTPSYRRVWLPIALSEFIQGAFYFTMLTWMGRSYLEFLPGGKDEHENVVGPPLWINIFGILIRALEPVMGSASCYFSAAVAFNKIESGSSKTFSDLIAESYKVIGVSLICYQMSLYVNN